MNKYEISFRAANNEHDIYGLVYEPENLKNAKGILQIAHGMCEHTGRYEDFAIFMAKNNYIVCINDHAGHGKSQSGIYGYMGAKDGYKHMVSDMYKLYNISREKYKQLPYFMLGHSMGSFLARYYAMQYGDSLDGIIYSGTGNPKEIAGAGIFFGRIMCRLKGGKAGGFLFNRLTNTLYNSKIEPKRTNCDWLTRDEAIVDKFMQDTTCYFCFTYAGYLDLFLLIKAISSNEWFENVPTDLPTFIFSGDKDPVGDYGKGCTAVYNKLKASGCKNIKLKLYPDGRHEMLNELNRQDVYQDVLGWLDEQLK